MLTLILLSVFGAIIAAVVGTFWYSNATPMGKIQMASIGCDALTPEEMKKRMEEAKPKMPKMYAAQMLLSFLTAFEVVVIVTFSIENGLSAVSAFGFVALNWLCFMVPIIGSAILWSNYDSKLAWKKFFSDIFANLLIVILVAITASLFA